MFSIGQFLTIYTRLKHLNKRIEAGEYLQIIIESEAAYQVDIEKSAQMIMERKDKVRLVLITGPSS